MFWFLIFILLNNFRITYFFLFCINVDIDEMFLLENKGLLVNFCKSYFPFVLEKAFWFLLLILMNNLRNLFIFCINVNTNNNNNNNNGLYFQRVTHLATIQANLP